MKNINATIITIGDEILIGQITDTNSQWMASELNQIGVKVHKMITIADDADEIKNEMTKALVHSEIILVTGGLGPTKDDLTKHTLAAYFDTKLIRNNTVYSKLKQYYQSKGRQLNELNATQADLPEACTILENNVGTASGMLFKTTKGCVISMPGVPREMKYIMNEGGALKYIKNNYQLPTIYHRTILTVGIAESDLAIKLASWEAALPETIKLAYLPSLGKVRLRLSSFNQQKEEAKASIAPLITELNQQIGPYIYGEGKETLQSVVAQIATTNKLTISLAESCTGGNIAHLFTELPGCSAFFKGAFVAYANDMKKKSVSVDSNTLLNYGAVSEETIIQMAENTRQKIDSDFCIATSGIAGPSGGTEEKPVGTVWIACACKNKTVTKLLKLTNNRLANIEIASIYAIDLLRRSLLEKTANP